MSSILEKNKYVRDIIITIITILRSPNFILVNSIGAGSILMWMVLNANRVIVFYSHIHPETHFPVHCRGAKEAVWVTLCFYFAKDALRSHYVLPGWHCNSSHPAESHNVICQELTLNFNAEITHPHHVWQ